MIWRDSCRKFQLRLFPLKFYEMIKIKLPLCIYVKWFFIRVCNECSNLVHKYVISYYFSPDIAIFIVECVPFVIITRVKLHVVFLLIVNY